MESQSESQSIKDNIPDLSYIINQLSQYADSHVQEIRMSIYGLGLFGAAIALRSVRFATKFTNGNQIPKSFIRKGIALRGTVHNISIDGTLHINHIPIYSMPWHKSLGEDKLLKVSLCSVNPTISGVYWLKLNTEQKNVWFKVLSRTNDRLQCLVSPEKKIPWKNCINITLIEKGIANVENYDVSLNKNETYTQLYKNLLKAEKCAKKSRSGIWYEPSLWDKIQQKIQIYLGMFKNIKDKLTL